MTPPTTGPLVAVTCPITHSRDVTCPSCRAEIVQSPAFGPSDADQVTLIRAELEDLRRRLSQAQALGHAIEAERDGFLDEVGALRSELAVAITAKADAERKLAAALKDAETVQAIGKEIRRERDRLRALGRMMWLRGKFERELDEAIAISSEAGELGVKP